MNRITNFLSSLLFFLLSIVIILTTVDFYSFNRSFYEKEYTESNTAEYIGISQDGLMEATTTLLDYLRDNRDDIVVEAEVNGEQREVFNERETAHMVDVKALYQNAVKVRNGMVVLCVALLLILYKLCKKDFIPVLKTGYGYGLGLVFLFVMFLAVWAIADFNAFWIRFHLFFFDNDLWLLDPNTSIMINMFPENFFQDLVIRIIVTIIALLAFVRVLLNLGEKLHDKYRIV